MIPKRAFVSAAGSKANERQIIKVRRILIHPNYEETSIKNDLALILLEEKPMNADPISLPKDGVVFPPKYSGSVCILTGWNLTNLQDGNIPARTVDSTTLKYTYSPWISDTECKKWAPKTFNAPSMFCSGKFSPEYTNRKGGCQNERGSPYLCRIANNWHVFGIFSQPGDSKCLHAAPNINMDLSQFKDWVEETIASVTENDPKSTDNQQCFSYLNMDFHAEPLEEINRKPFTSCCDLCKKTPGCSGYAWNQHHSGTCWLKTGSGPLVSRPGVRAGFIFDELTKDIQTSKIQNGCEAYEDKDYYTTGALYSVSYQESGACCDLCHAAPQCTGYAWNDYQNGTCWLKSGSGYFVNKQDTKAGKVVTGALDSDSQIKKKSCVQLLKRTIKGHDLYAIHGQKMSACCQLCRNAVGCQAYVWTAYHRGTCWLKSSNGSLTTDGESTAGFMTNLPKDKIEELMEVDCNFPPKNGYDQWNIPECQIFSLNNNSTVEDDSDNNSENSCSTSSNSAVNGKLMATIPYEPFSSCCSLCSKQDGCSGYTWSKSIRGGTCNLYKNITGILHDMPGHNLGLRNPHHIATEAENIQDEPVLILSMAKSGIFSKTAITKPTIDYPWITSIRENAGSFSQHACTATIISEQLLITTASCLHEDGTAELKKKESMSVAWNKKSLKIKEIQTHDQYFANIKSTMTNKYDIAIVQVQESFENMGLVAIEVADTSALWASGGSTCRTLGWSKDYYEPEMKAATVSMVNCSSYWNGIGSTILCAWQETINGTMGACADAAGAPLICKSGITNKWELVGLATFGTYHCLQKPAAYSNVPQLKSWISKTSLELKDHSSKKSEINYAVPAGIAVLVIIIFLLIGGIFIYHRRNQNNIQNQPNEFPRISKDQIKTLKKIGEGHFCDVWKGSYQPSESKNTKTVIVAVKILKVTAGDREQKQFLEEALILDKLKAHDYHIVSAIGLCLDSRPNFLVLEYMNGGSLLGFLRKECNRNNMTHKQLIQIAKDVNHACCFLEKKGYIHRDIAARNCLVELPKNKKAPVTVKLSDFGLAKDEKAIYMTPDPDLPVAWVAPEGFKGIFSIKSDVWSYGVLLWEVFSYGAEPFGQCSRPDNIHQCPLKTWDHSRIQKHVCENRETLLSLPEPCTAQFTELLRELMENCWNYLPDMRPSFENIGEQLQNAETSLSLIENEDVVASQEQEQPVSLQATTSTEMLRLESVASKHKISVAPSGKPGEYDKLQVEEPKTPGAESVQKKNYAYRTANSSSKPLLEFAYSDQSQSKDRVQVPESLELLNMV